MKNHPLAIFHLSTVEDKSKDFSMTGTINPRKPQPISLVSEEEAYNLLNDDDASFDPEEDIADRDTAGHVHNALLRMLGEANEEEMKIKVQYEENWINTTMNSISNRWDI